MDTRATSDLAPLGPAGPAVVPEAVPEVAVPEVVASSYNNDVAHAQHGRVAPGEVWRPRFLDLLAHNANVTASAKAAGISRWHAYQERAKDPAFAESWEAAVAEAVDGLEGALWERAKTDQRSDNVGMFLLRAHRPDIYREPREAATVKLADGDRSVTFTLDIGRPQVDEDDPT